MAASVACGPGNGSFVAPEVSVWNTGQTYKILMNGTNGFCYVTSISGDFRGDDEAIALNFVGPPGGNGVWVQYGQSGSKGVSFTVECSLWANYDLPNHQIRNAGWQKVVEVDEQVDDPMPLLCCPVTGDVYRGIGRVEDGLCPDKPVQCGTIIGTKTTQTYPNVTVPIGSGSLFCNLAGLRGAMNDGTDQVIVKNAITNGSNTATLDVEHPSPGGTTWGSAACISYDWPPPGNSQDLQTFRWVQGQPQATPMIPSNAGVCMLTSIGGGFHGPSESVQIVRDNIQSSNPILLTGTSQQSGVYGEAVCVRYSR